MTSGVLFSAQDYFIIIFSVMKLREITKTLVSSNILFNEVFQSRESSCLGGSFNGLFNTKH